MYLLKKKLIFPNIKVPPDSSRFFATDVTTLLNEGALIYLHSANHLTLKKDYSP